MRAASSVAARDEITEFLHRMSFASVGFLDDFERKAALLAFEHQLPPNG